LAKSGINVAYFTTLVVLCAGLTVLLGYEIGWLFARDRSSLAVAGVFVPWVLFFAWKVSDGE
jgi:hypothetical protein